MTYSRHGHSRHVYYANHLGTVHRDQIVALLYAVQGPVCYLCERHLRRRQVNIDHVVPRFRGGAHHPYNWALTHRACNQRKGHRMPTARELERHRRILSRLRWALFRIRLRSLFHRVLRLIHRPVQRS